jgi:hypothetical protein
MIRWADMILAAMINDIGALVPGQSKSTAAFTEAKICGYHDPSSEGSGQVLMGTITIR